MVRHGSGGTYSGSIGHSSGGGSAPSGGGGGGGGHTSGDIGFGRHSSGGVQTHSSGGHSSGGGAAAPSVTKPKEEAKFYYNPQTKSYSTQRVTGQQPVTRAEATRRPAVVSSFNLGVSPGAISKPTPTRLEARTTPFKEDRGLDAALSAAKRGERGRIGDFAQPTAAKFVSRRELIGAGEEAFKQPMFIAEEPRPRPQIVEEERKAKRGYFGTPILEPFKRVREPLREASKAIVKAEREGVDTGVGRGLVGFSQAQEDISKSIGETTIGRGVAEVTPIQAGIGTAAIGAIVFAPKVTEYVARQAVKAYAIPKAVKAVGTITAPKEQKEIIKSEGFREIVGKGMAAQSAELYGQAWYKGVAGELPIVPLFLGEETYEKTVRAEFKAQGLTGKKLDTAVSAAKRQQKFGQAGELAAQLEIARSSEAYGRKGFEVAKRKMAEAGKTFTTKKAFSEMFKLSYKPIAKAGLGEGIGAEIAQEVSREQDISAKKIAISGAVGAASAGVIGGFIAGTRLTKPAVSKVVEYGTYIVDPLEKPGDILQDITELATKKITGKAPPVTAITQAFDPGDVLTFTKGKGKGIVPDTEVITPGAAFPLAPLAPVQAPPKKPKVPKEGLRVRTLVGINIPQPLQTPSTLPVPTPIPVQIPKAPIGTNIFVGTQVDVPIPIDIPVDVPVDIPIDIPVDVPVDIPVDVPIQTQVPTSINIPTITPLWRIPPPLPLGFPGLGTMGGAGARKGKRRRYVDEVAAGSALLGQLLTGRGIPKPKRPQAAKRSTAPKKKTTKNKVKKQPTQQQRINKSIREFWS